MCRELFKKNADGILDRKRYFDYLQFLGKWSRKISIQTKGLESVFKFCGFAWKEEILSDENMKSSEVPNKIKL